MCFTVWLTGFFFTLGFGLSLPEDPWEKLLAPLAIIIVWPLVLGGHASTNAENEQPLRPYIASVAAARPHGDGALWRFGVLGCITSKRMVVDLWFW
jgi:hypothetical protein